jgi:proline utilization trans-activator
VSQKCVIHALIAERNLLTSAYSYLEEILSENAKLRQQSRTTQTNSSVEAAEVLGRVARNGEPNDGPIRNPLFDDRPWFLHTSTLAAPILIGEAADAAFTTRFRQTLSVGAFGHIPRINYPPDNTLLSLGSSACPLPTPGRARFLLRAALRIVSDHYHMVLKSVVLEGLEIFLRQPTTSDILLTSKMWALLALGEAYSARSGSSDPVFPGLPYFSQANRALQVIQERPSLDSIEVLLLLVRTTPRKALVTLP